MEPKLLFDTRSWLEDISRKDLYDEYLEECEMNGIEPSSMDSNEYMSWCIELERRNMEDDLDNIRCSANLRGSWVITGTLGLWDGRHTIIPVVVDGLSAAILRCAEDDVKVSYDSSSVYVSSSHHDGTNSFTIRKLSRKALDIINSDCESAVTEAVSSGKDKGFYETLPEYLY